MTKARGMAWPLLGLLLLAVASAPTAAAHGAPPVRAIDTRVVLDDDGPLGFGGCLEGNCVVPVGTAADLLALDVREAALADGSPAIAFRLVLQSEEAPAGAALALSFTAKGAAKTFSLATPDGLAWASPDFERLDGPFDVGDGQPKALDGWVRHATLGVGPGDVLGDIAVASSRDGSMDDVMPGTWFAQGQPVPSTTVPGTEPAPPSYTVQGPAALLTVTLDKPNVTAPATVVVRLSNPVDFPQFVNLALVLPDGTTARLAQAGVSLDPSGARELDLVLTGAVSDGVVTLLASSDLGAYHAADLAVAAPPPPANATGGPEQDHEESKDAPALSVVLLAASLLAFALLRRR